jgi:hypothetical protein
MGNVVNSIHISRFSRWTGITGSIRTPRIQSRALPDSFTAKIDGDDRETQTPRNRCLWYQVLGRRIWGSRDSREGDRIEKHRGREERRWKLRRFNFRIQFMSVYYSCTPQHLYARSTQHTRARHPCHCLAFNFKPNQRPWLWCWAGVAWFPDVAQQQHPSLVPYQQHCWHTCYCEYYLFSWQFPYQYFGALFSLFKVNIWSWNGRNISHLLSLICLTKVNLFD